MSAIGAIAGCPVCGSHETRELGSQPADFEYRVPFDRDLRVRACVSCESEFLQPRPSTEEIASFYPDDYYAYHHELGPVSRWLFDRRCRARARALTELLGDGPIRLFDVGAGDCRHFDAMAAYGEFEFSGVEMDAGAARAAADRGYRVVPGFFEDLDLSSHAGEYDAVTLNHVIEHVLDPADALARALRVLRPGGCVMGTAPCLASLDRRLFGRYWGGYHFPRHLQHFVPGSLRALFERVGFVDVEIRSDLNQLAAVSCQNALIGRFGWPRSTPQGRSALFGPLLVLTAPFSVLEHALGLGGCLFFTARRAG